MSATSRVAGAVAAGYALGRFKKLRLAVLVATAMSNPKFRSAAVGLIQDRIPAGTIVGPLTKEFGGRLLDAGKSAATSVVASRIGTLSESLAERSQTMRKAKGGESSKSQDEDAESNKRPEESEEEGYDEQSDVAEPEDEFQEGEGEEAEEPQDEYEEEPQDEYEEGEGEEAEEPQDEYEEGEGEEAEEPQDEYEEDEGEEAEEPQDEYEEDEGEVAEEPEAEARPEEEESPEQEPEEPVARSPRRRRSASPAGRGRK
jgi:hypothetical protein